MGVRIRLLLRICFVSPLVLFLVSAQPAPAATPSSGTMSPGGADLTWSGGPFTDVAGDPIAADCNNSTCDNFILTVTGGDATQYELRVEINWLNPANDLDLHILDNTTGSSLDVGGEAVSNFESVAIPAASGEYRVSVLIYRAVAESYTARATIVATGSTPEPPNTFRTANYHRFDFGFKPEVKLPEQERSNAFIDQDVEPEIEIDRFGTIYVGAIRGIPGGVDFWRSDNGGTSFLYLGQPDGTQNPAPFPPSPEGGVGGGDVDISLGAPFDVVPATPGSPAIRSTGRIFCSSLWLGSATMSVSIDRGENWAPFPFTTAQLDRQWHSTTGEKTTYMSLRKVSSIELDENDIYVIQSDDGATFTKGSYVMKPLASSTADDLAGNSVLTQEGYLVGSFASRDGRDLYIYKSRTAPPTLPPAPTEVSYDPNAFVVDRIFHGAGGMTTNNTFPIMALDKGNNIHLAFSDRHDIYLMSCAAGQDPADSTQWTQPVRLNAPGVAGFEFATTSLFPWISGGDAGKVICLWYGTTVAGDADSPTFEEQAVPWKIVYAQVENALSATPDVYLDIASKQGGGVIHTGQICTRGLGCPDGTRELAEYSSLTMDLDGFANIAYTGTIHNGVDPPSTAAIVFFTKATIRPAQQTETIIELECHDSRISRSGGWHDIEDVRATKGSYCRNVGHSKGSSKLYLEFQFEGNTVDLQIARGSRGGNAEVLIDGVSRGKVDFWRVASDPAHPDNSGRKDLTFGEFVSFDVTPGSHTFRLNVTNDSPDSQRDMVYVDGIVIHGGSSSGQGNPTESSTTVQGTVPGGTQLTPGVSTQTITASAATSLLTGVLEMTDGSDLDLVLLNPAGAVLATAATLSPTEVTRHDPAAPGMYTFLVKNKGSAPADYRLSTVRTEDGGGSLAAAAPHGATHTTKLGTFDPSGSIRYTVASGGRVLIRVFSANGRLVRTILDQASGPGRHVTHWNGRADDGARLASGVYLFRVQHPNGDLSTAKTVLLR